MATLKSLKQVLTVTCCLPTSHPTKRAECRDHKVRLCALLQCAQLRQSNSEQMEQAMELSEKLSKEKREREEEKDGLMAKCVLLPHY